MDIPPKKNQLKFLKAKEEQPFQSKHLLLELYGCNYEKLDDESFVRCTLNLSLIHI